MFLLNILLTFKDKKAVPPLIGAERRLRNVAPASLVALDRGRASASEYRGLPLGGLDRGASVGFGGFACRKIRQERAFFEVKMRFFWKNSFFFAFFVALSRY